jgi:diguanylate cyclase (GGDEF)-like protein
MIDQFVDAATTPWSLLWVIVAFGAAPSFALRLITRLYPKDDVRRTELRAELYAVPHFIRPLWVAEQLELACFEGLSTRWRLASTSRRVRSMTRLPGKDRWHWDATSAMISPANTGRTPILVILDVDDFEALNTRYGRTGGDAVLGELAHRLLRLSGKTGILGRLGGDEFAILFHHGETNLNSPLQLVDKIHAAVQSSTTTLFRDGRTSSIRGVKVSIGAATSTDATPRLNDLFSAARSALSETKREDKGAVRVQVLPLAS